MRKTLTKNTSPIGMSSKSPDRSIAPLLRALRARAAVTPARDDDDDDGDDDDDDDDDDARGARARERCARCLRGDACDRAATVRGIRDGGRARDDAR